MFVKFNVFNLNDLASSNRKNPLKQITIIANADLTPKHCFYGRPRTSTDVLSTAVLRFFDQNREHPAEDCVVTLVQRVLTTSYGCVTGT